MIKSTIVLVVLAIIATGLWAYYGQVGTSEPAVNSPIVIPIASTPKATTTTPTTKSNQSNTGKTQAILSYSKAINLYANSRIQFDAECHANPASLHIKNGSNIMLDNRSGSITRLTVDGTKYSLAGFGFQIIGLSHKTLPYTAAVDCGSGRNTAQILLQ